MAFGALVVTVFILYFQPAAVFPEMASLTPFRYSIVITLILYFFSPPSQNNSRSFFSLKVNNIFVVFVFIQIISATLNIWIQSGLDIAETWFKAGVLYFLIFKLVSSEFRAKSIILAIVSGILYLSWYSITEYFKLLDMAGYAYARGLGWYDGKNDIANILVCVVPLTFYLLEKTNVKIFRTLLLSVILLFCLNICLTASRAGILGIAAVLPLSILKSETVGKVLKIAILVTALLGVVAIGYKVILDRPDVDSDSLSVGGDRMEQWAAGVKMTIKNPLLGVGPGEYRYRCDEYGGVRGLKTHNTFIQVFAESGIIAGYLFIMFFVIPVRKMFLYPDKVNAFGTYSTISIIGFGVCAFFQNCDQAWILYTLIALIMASYQWEKNGGNEKTD